MRRSRPNRLTSAVEENALKILVVAHVFYPEHWKELLACIRTVGPTADVIVTYADEAAVAAARGDLPTATFLPCENRGFDVWPFLYALQKADLAKYDLVVKLHTKRDIDPKLRFRFNRLRFDGPAWRNRLLAFCRTPEAWRRTLRRFAEPSVGMVAERDVIVRRRDVTRADAVQAYDAALREVSTLGGRTVSARSGQFVAGTMFAVRSDVLRFLLCRGFGPEAFAPSAHVTVEDLEYAHVVERMFGLAVSACGLKVVAFNGVLFWHRLLKHFQ